MSNIVKVGMAEYKAVLYPGILITLGLGSCVGICLYDPISKVSGMAHIMLPSSKLIKNNSNPGKFADTAIRNLLEEMIILGADRKRIISKIAGGAQMFNFMSNDLMRIGERNTEAVKDELNKLKIPIVAEEIGGNYGRTIEFYSENGILKIKTIGHGTIEI